MSATGKDAPGSSGTLVSALLSWYDEHARALPWRIPPSASIAGERADPYRVWLSEIMLQQTTVATVKPYFETFTRRWPTVVDLAQAQDGDVMAAWAGLGYYARARNLLKCARVIAHDHAGTFPQSQKELAKLPGVGPYTAAAVAAIAFDQAAVVFDGNVERVMARYHDHREPLPKAKAALKAYAARLTPHVRPGDYAQAVMDLGATVCTPRRPACDRCPWAQGCLARLNDMAQDLPMKTPKAAKPTRRGVAYLARHPDGGVLLERRPPRGLLGGMLAMPTTQWVENDQPVPGDPPMAGAWQEADLEARHTFTHFHLVLRVHLLTTDGEPSRGRWFGGDEVNRADLPTLMRKVWDIGEKFEGGATHAPPLERVL